ncbi:geranylgeranyl reductase family protein [Collimonas sp. OK412]|jgi:geranylgeranyl reductase family protein|uniref:geranylgeranyl reductase family protein n=1 Tax=Collimonas sp. (strain OK412) TaxID=1801619 RepID=UPI001587A774|nr:geranylgeranyl reductase family protein [Collimonas sp. OK412]
MSFDDAVADVLVVGAGPAGSHLAYLLAGQGLQVTLIDKQAFPRAKVCGGGLSRKTMDLLGFDLGPVMHRAIGGAILNYRNRDAILKEVQPMAACTVVRSEFDQLLLDRACARGVRFLAETGFVDATETADAVSVATSRGVLRCRLLLAADGAASAVRNKLFGKDLVAYVPAMEAMLWPAPGMLERFGDRALFDFDGMPRGYGWIFPKRDHFNVGVYSPFGGAALRQHLDRFIAAYASLRQPSRLECQGYVIPLQNRRQLYQRGRVWLLGDAAGLAEALFGEGIYFALKSATIAAKAIAADGLRAESALYSRLLRRELLPELRAAAWMARLIYRFPKLAFSHLVLNQQINHDFAGLISGQVGYRDCLLKTALGFPRWLLPSKAPDSAADNVC